MIEIYRNIVSSGISIRLKLKRSHIASLKYYIQTKKWETVKSYYLSLQCHFNRFIVFSIHFSIELEIGKLSFRELGNYTVASILLYVIKREKKFQFLASLGNSSVY